MTLDESIQGMRLQVIRRASQIGVSAACAEAGISRTLFYRWQQRLSRYGVDGLHPRRLRARPGRPPQLPAQVERRLLAVAIAEATWGAQRLAAYAQRLWRLRVAASTVQRLLRAPSRFGDRDGEQPPLDLGGQLRRASGSRLQPTRMQAVHPVAAEAVLPSVEQRAGDARLGAGPAHPDLRRTTNDLQPHPLYALVEGHRSSCPKVGSLVGFHSGTDGADGPHFLSAEVSTLMRLRTN